MKNILEVIKKAPEDHVYYSPLIGECHVKIIKDTDYPILANRINDNDGVSLLLSEDGKYIIDSDLPGGECILFPSRDNRDWEAFERELDGTKEAMQYVPVSENGVLSGYYQVVGVTEINLDHEYYKEHPYVNFHIDGKEYKVSIKDIKERFRVVDSDKYSINIEDEQKNVSGKSFFDNTFNGTPKIVWDDNAKKIIKMAEKWQREIEKIEKHWKEVDPMMREMAQRINEMYKEYQRRNNHDKRTD